MAVAALQMAEKKVWAPRPGGDAVGRVFRLLWNAGEEAAFGQRIPEPVDIMALQP